MTMTNVEKLQLAAKLLDEVFENIDDSVAISYDFEMDLWQAMRTVDNCYITLLALEESV